MKIFLLGDYSGVHSALRQGLIELGHEVVLASSGDGYKKFGNDINIRVRYKTIIMSHIMKRLNYLICVLKIIGYDVVQFMHPSILPLPYWMTNLLISYLKFFNKKVFVVISGGDGYVIPYLMKELEYTPHLNEIKENFFGSKYKKFNKKQSQLAINKAKKFTGIISIAYSYHIPYKDFSNYKGFIPMPANVFYEQPNIVKAKIKILHGILRREDKGSSYILKALDMIKKYFPNQVEVTIVEKLPFKEYIEIVREHNILIDQACSYSYGMNGVFGLAQSKVVLSGHEPEIEELYGEKCPVINIRPDVQYIYNVLKELILNEDTIEQKGKESYRYAYKFHHFLEITKKYLDVWERS